MVNPDLEIRGEGGRSSRPLDKGGGGGRSPKKFFSALRASVSSRNKVEQGPSPGSPLLNLVSKLEVTPFGHR